MRFATYTGSFTGARFIEFCRKLMADAEGPVYLVVDGHPTHRSKLVKEFVASTDGALKLFVLPADPRSSTRTSGCGRTSSTTGSDAPPSPDPDEFKSKIIGALRRLQKLPHIVREVSPIPTCGTSPHDQSQLTNELLSKPRNELRFIWFGGRNLACWALRSTSMTAGPGLIRRSRAGAASGPRRSRPATAGSSSPGRPGTPPAG